MNRFFALLTALLLLCTSAALAQTAPVVEAPTFDWQRDSMQHWQLSGEGEKLNAAPHALEEFTCSVCGSEVWLSEDGFADLYDYNAHGDMTRYTSLDPEGNILIEITYAYEYSAEGVKVRELEFYDGVLLREASYAVNAQGENHPVHQTAWYDDGSWALDEFDEHGNIVRAFVYDADGKVTFESESEYAPGADGWYYETKNTIRMENSVFYTEYNEYGDAVRTLNSDNGEVWADHRYEYAYDNGTMRWRKQYEKDQLLLETLYDSWGYIETEVEYLAGGEQVISSYNENGDLVKAVFRLADGTVEQEETYEYAYDDEMNLLRTTAYVNGKLTLETEYAMDADGWSYAAAETLYGEDGSRTVTSYDAEGGITGVVTYNADGIVAE